MKNLPSRKFTLRGLCWSLMPLLLLSQAQAEQRPVTRFAQETEQDGHATLGRRNTNQLRLRGISLADDSLELHAPNQLRTDSADERLPLNAPVNVPRENSQRLPLLPVGGPTPPQDGNLAPPPSQENRGANDGGLYPSTAPRRLPDSHDAGPVTPATDADNQATPLAPAALTFHGLVPGRSTMKEVQQALGRPLAERQLSGGRLFEYHVEPFRRVDIFLRACPRLGMVLQSIVIHPELEITEATAVEELQLHDILPAAILDEHGNQRGHAYPERGVILSFEESAPNRLSKIILEPLDAQAFILRAEQRYRTTPLSALRDCQIASGLQPELALAHSQRAVVLASLDQPDDAYAACQKALALEPRSVVHAIEHARMLCEIGKFDEATKQAQSVWPLTAQDPLARAQDLNVLARAAALGSKHDHRSAVQWSMEAIRLAQDSISDARPTVRQSAERTVLEAHLDTARHIADGQWKSKPAAVQQWLLRAREFADGATPQDQASNLFETGCVALACCAQLQGKLDPAPWHALVNDAAQQLSSQVGGCRC